MSPSHAGPPRRTSCCPPAPRGGGGRAAGGGGGGRYRAVEEDASTLALPVVRAARRSTHRGEVEEDATGSPGKTRRHLHHRPPAPQGGRGGGCRASTRAAAEEHALGRPHHGPWVGAGVATGGGGVDLAGLLAFRGAGEPPTWSCSC
jgi:hypothetical protein